jgi:hypothetical protein
MIKAKIIDYFCIKRISEIKLQYIGTRIFLLKILVNSMRMFFLYFQSKNEEELVWHICLFQDQ